MSRTARTSPLPYRERDPLLQRIERTPSGHAKTPPPSYYQSATDFDNTLPSYQEVTENIHRTNQIQESDTSNLYPEPRPNAYAGLAAIAFFCCCFSPLACIALYYSARVKEHYEAGDYSKSKSASRKTFACSVLAVVVGLVTLLIVTLTLFCVFYSECKSKVMSIL